jgi:hypothetical protein
MPTAYPFSRTPYISLSQFLHPIHLLDQKGMEIEPINRGLLDRPSGIKHQTTTNPKPTNHDPAVAVDIPTSAVAFQPTVAAGSAAAATKVLVRQWWWP